MLSKTIAPLTLALIPSCGVSVPVAPVLNQLPPQISQCEYEPKYKEANRELLNLGAAYSECSRKLDEVVGIYNESMS